MYLLRSYISTREILMRVRVQKWGNSLALRIPKSFATETEIDPGSEVDLTLEGGRLIITPLVQPGPSLNDLLLGITPENLHTELDFGSATGHEVW
jgi:antitoxin MazE